MGDVWEMKKGGEVMLTWWKRVWVGRSDGKCTFGGGGAFRRGTGVHEEEGTGYQTRPPRPSYHPRPSPPHPHPSKTDPSLPPGRGVVVGFKIDLDTVVGRGHFRGGGVGVVGGLTLEEGEVLIFYGESRGTTIS